jgi:hypothetical protein
VEIKGKKGKEKGNIEKKKRQRRKESKARHRKR